MKDNHANAIRYLLAQNERLTEEIERRQDTIHLYRKTYAYLLRQPWFRQHKKDIAKHITEKILPKP